MSTSASPSDVVKAQVDAYNKRDLDAFVAMYAEEAIIVNNEGEVAFTGRDAMRETYQTLFDQSPKLKVRVVKQMKVGDWVIAEEKASGMELEGMPETIHAVIAYQVIEGRIIKAQTFA